MKRRTTRKNETDEISKALQGQGRNRKKERKKAKRWAGEGSWTRREK